MIWQLENWSWKNNLPPEISSGDSFIQCVFVQNIKDKQIFSGLADLKFIDCNLINCAIPVDAKVSSCNVAKNKYKKVKNDELNIDEYHFESNEGKSNIIGNIMSSEDRLLVFKAWKDLPKNKKNKFIEKLYSKEIEEV